MVDAVAANTSGFCSLRAGFTLLPPEGESQADIIPCTFVGRRQFGTDGAAVPPGAVLIGGCVRQAEEEGDAAALARAQAAMAGSGPKRTRLQQLVQWCAEHTFQTNVQCHFHTHTTLVRKDSRRLAPTYLLC